MEWLPLATHAKRFEIPSVHHLHLRLRVIPS
jgi:hypothetical protein